MHQDSFHRDFLRREMAVASGKEQKWTVLSMEAFGFEVEEEISVMVSQTWAEGCGLEDGTLNKREALLNLFFGDK